MQTTADILKATAELPKYASRTLAASRVAGGQWVALVGRMAEDGHRELVLEVRTDAPRTQESLPVVVPAGLGTVGLAVWTRREGADALSALVGGENVLGTVVVA